MSGYVRPKGLVVLRCVLVVLALVLGASTLSACGDAEGAGSAEDGVSKDVPGLPDGTPVRVIEDVDHEQVIVPADPQRVVTLSEPTLDGALTLGVKPVGTVNGRGSRVCRTTSRTWPRASPPWVASRSSTSRPSASSSPT